ncbi:MAG: hypothetical protein D3924_20910, partial [Candidatus Electrothrix sp. AR4]|nr:hypothetical protein [Candidatus Electrothrix sp. AR4]
MEFQSSLLRNKSNEQERQDTTRSRQGSQIQPDTFRLFALHEEQLEAILRQAPLEQPGVSSKSRSAPVYIDIPNPDGSYARFEFVVSPVMEPELALKYPEITTYSGKLVGNDEVRARFDWTPSGFHAQVITPGSTWYVDPYSKGESYVSYYKRDYHPKNKGFECSTVDSDRNSFARRNVSARSGDTLRTFRIAVATTGEYAQFHGGTAPLALAAVVTTINRVNGIYEYELAVRLTLVANNNLIVYLNPSTDRFTGNNDASTLIDESQEVIDDVIGDSAYDIGHTFSTGAGGLAATPSVCQAGSKAQGVTGSDSPAGDPYDVDYV